jgi:hypothetical protein
MDNFDYEEFLKNDVAICDTEFTIHYLFLKEKREYFLMLGRSETIDDLSEHSHSIESKSQSDEASVALSSS